MEEGLVRSAAHARRGSTDGERRGDAVRQGWRESVEYGDAEPYHNACRGEEGTRRDSKALTSPPSVYRAKRPNDWRSAARRSSR